MAGALDLNHGVNLRPRPTQQRFGGRPGRARMLNRANRSVPVEVLMGTPDGEHTVYPPVRPRLSVDELLAAKNTQPIQSLDDLAADTFESDEELEEFIAFTYSERHHDVA